MGLLVARALYLFSPLLLAAVLAGIVQRFDVWTILKRPIDGGMSFRRRRVFGDNKTWRGVTCAIVGCIATVTVQKDHLADPAFLVSARLAARSDVVRAVRGRASVRQSCGICRRCAKAPDLNIDCGQPAGRRCQAEQQT